MSQQQLLEVAILQKVLLERAKADPESRPADLHHAARLRPLRAQQVEAFGKPFPGHDADFYLPAALHHGHNRRDAARDEVRVLRILLRLKQDGAVRKRDRLQSGQKRVPGRG